MFTHRTLRFVSKPISSGIRPVNRLPFKNLYTIHNQSEG